MFPLILVGITVTSVLSVERLAELLQSLWAKSDILTRSQVPVMV